MMSELAFRRLMPRTLSKYLGAPDRLVGKGKRPILLNGLGRNQPSTSLQTAFSTKHAQTEATEDSKKNLRPLSDMPGPRAYPFVGTMDPWASTSTTNVIPFFTERAVKYYPMYKERIIGSNVVMLVGTKEIEEFVRKESTYPNRFEIPMWTKYRKDSGRELGLFTGHDVQWHRMRSVTDKPLLRMKDVMSYTDEMNEVVTDFLKRLEAIRDDRGLVLNLETELFNWSLESIGSILYERRFGGLSEHRDPEMEEFIKSVGVMLQHTMDLLIFPVWLSKIIKGKQLKEHNQAWDTLFATAKKCVDKKMNEITSSAEKGEEKHGILAYLLTEGSLSAEEIYADVTELMFAAVDTTSNTTQFFLYEISRHPEINEKLCAEIDKVLPDGKIPTYRDLQDLPYLRACVKETLRLYPVAGSVSRVLDEDIELCGYLLPKKTTVAVPLYAVTRLPQHFDEPLEFRPERWLRDRSDRPNPFGSLPFGFGVRSCVGRRVAELELHLLLSRLLQRFKVGTDLTEPCLINMKLVLRPDRPLLIRLTDRK